MGIMLIAILCSRGWADTSDLSGPYIGQDLPGLEPCIFAPGVISLPNRFDFSGSFTPDGNEFYFTYSNSNWSGNSIMVSRNENGYWTAPVVVPFSGGDVDWSVYISPDGQKLFFSSGRPNQSWVLNIWMCERQGAGWGDPIKLDMNVGDRSDYVGTCTLDGTLYFASKRDLPKPTDQVAIYRSVLVNGNYTHVEKLPAPINTGQDNNPYIAPDESYLLFTSGRNCHDSDLYISYRYEDDSWTEPVNLGPSINTADWEGNAFLSPDCNFLFFTRDTGKQSARREVDLYWVDTRAVFPDPNGPIENKDSGECFGSIQCAINYAEDGDTLIIQPGIYEESLILTKDITLVCADPNEQIIIGR
jgi:hypothetical protein